MPLIRTRDYNMLNVIRGVTKSGVHRDNKKHLSKQWCRGSKKMFARKEMEWNCSIEWTRPAEHGGYELFDVYGWRDGDKVHVVKALFVDEEDAATPFNLSSFNDEEILDMQDKLLQS